MNIFANDNYIHTMGTAEESGGNSPVSVVKFSFNILFATISVEHYQPLASMITKKHLLN